MCMPYSCTNQCTIHAEHDAILKLPTLSRRNKRHKKQIDLVVVRASKTGCLGNSRPCYHCLLLLSSLPPKKGYQINRIYYSNENGDIIDASLEALLFAESPHISKYYRL